MPNITNDTTSLDTILKDLENKKKVLPEFQRNYIWNISQAEELFDSLIRGIFIGSAILAQPDFDLACKEIDARPRGSRRHRPKAEDYTANQFNSKKIQCVLDGQQRLTSIYRVLKGIDVLYIKLKGIEDLEALNADSDDLDITDYFDGICSTRPDPSHYCIAISDLYKNRKAMESQLVGALHSPAMDAMKVRPDETQGMIYFRFLARLKSDFSNLTANDAILAVNVLDMDLDKFCKFFERSNSRGMTLNFVDILTAKLYTGFKLTTSINDFKSEFPSHEIAENKEVLIRYISFLSTGDVTKKIILKELSASHFTAKWESVKDRYVAAYDFIKSNNLIIGMSYLPYKMMLAPTMSFIDNLPNKDASQATEEQVRLFRHWFWMSLIDNRYGGARHGSTNVTLKEDCSHLGLLAKNGSLSQKYWSKFKANIDLQDMLRSNDRAALTRGIVSVLNYHSPLLKLENGTSVSFDSGNVESHHIFPRKYVEENFDSNSDDIDFMNSVLNRTYINKVPNIKYGKKRPSTYLNESPITENSRLIECLESHFVPNPQALVNGDYDTELMRFMEERFDLIYSKLKDILIDPHNHLTQEKPPASN